MLFRFCGTTEFAIGMWGGVELDSADGKNDGVVKGIRYFRYGKMYTVVLILLAQNTFSFIPAHNTFGTPSTKIFFLL